MYTFPIKLVFFVFIMDTNCSSLDDTKWQKSCFELNNKFEGKISIFDWRQGLLCTREWVGAGVRLLSTCSWIHSVPLSMIFPFVLISGTFHTRKTTHFHWVFDRDGLVLTRAWKIRDRAQGVFIIEFTYEIMWMASKELVFDFKLG